MIRMINPRDGSYSSLVFGISITTAIYLGFALCAVTGATPPNWLWLLMLTFPVFGLLIQIKTRRIIVIGCFRIIVSLLMTLTYGYLFWLVVAQNLEGIYRSLTGAAIGAALLALAIGLFRTNQSRSYLAKMPHGPSGTLNPKTGYVDPTVSPSALQGQREQAERSLRFLLRWAPLAAGLSMLLVRSLSASGITITIMIIAFVVAAGGASAVGSLCYFLVASLRWEQENGKQIRLKTW